MLVTLICTMFGFTRKNFKISMWLLAGMVALSLAWSYLSHLWFAIIVACARAGSSGQKCLG